MLDRLKTRARTLKQDVYALYLAYRDRRTPWYAKVFAGLVAAYAFSPIDLIPDFIPVLGYLDDLMLLPLGIALAIRMIPAEVMADCREKAAETTRDNHPVSWAAAAVIALIWIAFAVVIIRWALRVLHR